MNLAVYSARRNNMMTDIVGGVSTFATTYIVASEAIGEPAWVQLLIALGSALIYAAINLGVKILTARLKKDGKISADDAKAINGTVDDLTDDGKINGSNVDSDKKVK